MNVQFATKNPIAGSYIITGETSNSVLFFTQGFYETNEKDLIKQIMKTPQFKREEIVLVTDEDLVTDYLYDESRQDFFTEELLKTVSDDGVKLLGLHFKVKMKDPRLIRLALVDTPISNIAEEIISQNPYEEEIDLVAEAINAGDIVYNKPWYKSKDGKPIGKSKEEVIEFLTKTKFGA